MTADTIYALSSGRPPAGIAIVRVSGPEAHAAGAALAGSLPRERQSAMREFRHPGTREILDHGLVLRFDAPASATGEDVVELHCHGGRAVIDALLEALGWLPTLREAQPGEFTRRAFANGRIDLTEAEGLADLLEAETQSQRRAALAMAEGGLRRQIDEWQDRVLDLSAMAERAIDYDEDDEVLDPNLVEGCTALAEELGAWLERPRAEPLKDGIRVVAAGPPNSGKSSLINAIAGVERAIVTDIPGTTRDVIEIPMSIAGIPLLLTDTAGLRDSDEAVETIGIEKAKALVGSADILLWLGAVGDAPSHLNLISVASKADIAVRPSPSAHPVSAVTGEGLSALMHMIVTRARSLLPAEDALAINRRQADLLHAAQHALAVAASVEDLVLIADALRHVRLLFDRLSGRAGIEDVLDRLFGRFCLGK